MLQRHSAAWRVMRNLNLSFPFLSFPFPSPASHSELPATKRKNCLGAGSWEHLQLAESINLYNAVTLWGFFSSTLVPYWLNTFLYSSTDLSMASPVIKAASIIAAACSCEDLTLETDWHYVNSLLIWNVRSHTTKTEQVNLRFSCSSKVWAVPKQRGFFLFIISHLSCTRHFLV